MRILPLFVVGLAACAGHGQPGAVQPADIPNLQAALRQQPGNVDLRFRLASALAAAGRCDTATVVVASTQPLAPSDVRGPLIVGGCQETAGRYDLAIATYDQFASAHPQARGVAALRARSTLALRAQSVQTARAALANEAQLSSQPPAPATLAVLPLAVSGDSIYQPLSRGLAELLTTDLATVRTLHLIERVQVGALLDEMKLGQGGGVDPTTAARVGHLLRAERMVQGVAAVTKSQPVQLSASLVGGNGTVQSAGQVSGPFKSLLDLEKRLVFDLAAGLGIQLTEAERQKILQQGPKNMAAFLAYSNGLNALDKGDYAGAAAAFGAAVKSDPSFGAAQQGLQSAQAAPVVSGAGAGDVSTVVQQTQTVGGGTGGGPEPQSGALNSASTDVNPTLTDVVSQNTGTGTNTGDQNTQNQTTPDARGISTITQASGVIRIIFRRPP